MARVRRLSTLALILGVFFLGLAGVAEARKPPCPPPTYPPVTPSGDCNPPENPCAKVKFQIEVGKRFRVKGKKFCAAPGDIDVDVFIRPFGGGTETFLGSTPVLKNRKYKFKLATLPSLPPGFYEVVVRTDGTEYVAIIRIEPASSFAAITGRSPSNYAVLSLWALVLGGMAYALVFAPRRGWRVLPSLGRLRASGKAPALPPPDVPFLDTRGFVPTRPPDEPKGDVIDPDAR